MIMFVYPIIVLFLMILLHVFFVRKLSDSSQINIISILFAAGFACLLVVFYFLKSNIVNVLAGLLMYVSLACAYIQTFPAVQTFAPSLKILYLVDKNKSLSLEQISNFFTEKSLLDARVSELFQDGFLLESNNIYSLSKKGTFLALVFALFRKFYGLKKGLG